MKTLTLFEVIAMQHFWIAESGANKPLFIRGVDTRQHESGDYVLKYQGAERMDATACGRELLAAFLAALLDINTPEPVIIHVGPDFVETMRGSSVYPQVAKSIGINFGSRYIPGNIPLRPTQSLSREQAQQAARIFIFDLLIKNSDRNHLKPNLFLADDKIYIIDHELAFGFLFTLPSLLSPVAWQLNHTDVTDAGNHFFYSFLRQKAKTIDWEEAFEPLTNFHQEYWSKMEELIPSAWKNELMFDNIHSHIDAVFSNLASFKSEIWNKLLAQ